MLKHFCRNIKKRNLPPEPNLPPLFRNKKKKKKEGSCHSMIFTLINFMASVQQLYYSACEILLTQWESSLQHNSQNISFVSQIWWAVECCPAWDAVFFVGADLWKQGEKKPLLGVKILFLSAFMRSVVWAWCHQPLAAKSSFPRLCAPCILMW